MYRCITSLLAAALVAAAEAQSQVTPTFEVASVNKASATLDRRPRTTLLTGMRPPICRFDA